MSNIERARAAWGEDIPDWVTVLAEDCDRSSQKAAGNRIGYSSSVINQVLKRNYVGGDLAAVELAVRGALLSAVVDCPVLGELPTHECLSAQRRPYGNTNPIRVQLYRACRSGCAHSRLKGRDQG